MFLRFNHLKLVAKVPLKASEDGQDDEHIEICLGKYTSSVAKMKYGVLELYDGALLRVVEGWMPMLLVGGDEEEGESSKEKSGDEVDVEKIALLKKSPFYQVIMATAMCMIKSEKEKRHTLLDLIIQAGEGGGGAG